MSKCSRIIVAAALICLLCLVLGCTMAKISGTGEVPLILNQPQAKIQTIQKFKHSKMIIFDYTSAFDVSEVLNEVMIGSNADAIINLRITVKMNFADFAVNLLTIGIANAHHFEVSGTAIKAPEGLSLLPGYEVETLAHSSQIGQFLAFVQQDSPGTKMAIIPDNKKDGDKLYKLVRYEERP